MEPGIATSLIKKGLKPDLTQSWADLGAGSGLFTHALSTILGDGSTIYSIDKEVSGFKHGGLPGIQIVRTDFTNGIGPIKDLDGILMANSLHFVRDKVALIKKLSTHLKKDGRFILVEYDTDQSNTWVPYPISFKSLSKLVTENKLGTIEKIGHADSAYQSSGMYSVVIKL